MKWVLFLWLPVMLCSQNTVGTLQWDKERSVEGYNLLAPNYQSDVFLIDNCGRVVHKWEDNQNARSGAEQYLLPDGHLLKAKADIDVVDVSSIGAGGAGGILEIRTWENELVWQYIIQDSLQRQHHDIHYMPNGNILAIVWDRYFYEDIVNAGFDTTAYTQTELWPDKIIEINPSTSEIVWEWKAWDHMVQDVYPDKNNFGIVSDHPELIDINYQDYTFDRADFMHGNGIDYHPDLDQILLSVKNFNEIWIIDHSTTTEEAASHTGGQSGRGGDLLFRWGNPHAYKQGTPADQKLFSQHDPEWIMNEQSDYYNQILLFNNFIDINLSLGLILQPQYDANTHSYIMEENVFLPGEETRHISHPDTLLNFSTAGSNIEMLENGHFLIHAARPGFAFELTEDEEVIWEYKVPLRNGFPVSQGTILETSENFTFSLRRYAKEFSAFEGKDLTPLYYLESDPNEDFCNGLVDTEDFLPHNVLIVYPNPANKVVYIEHPRQNLDVSVFNISGELIYFAEAIDQRTEIPVDSWKSGCYILKTSSGEVHRLIRI